MILPASPCMLTYNFTVLLVKIDSLFLQILRCHVMVRVGGGCDTLDNFLSRHDVNKIGRILTGKNCLWSSFCNTLVQETVTLKPC